MISLLFSSVVAPGPTRRQLPCSAGNSRGFTLVEMITTVLILAILAAIGIPAYGNFVAGQRIKTASFDVMSTLMFARSEALKRNANVTVTPVSGTNWANGWSVTSDALTLNQQSAYRGLTLTGPATLTYNNNGRLNAAITSFSISSSGNSTATRCIRVDLSGRPNSKKGACS